MFQKNVRYILLHEAGEYIARTSDCVAGDDWNTETSFKPMYSGGFLQGGHLCLCKPRFINLRPERGSEIAKYVKMKNFSRGYGNRPEHDNITKPGCRHIT